MGISPGMVPMLSPDGKSGDIPAEKVQEAISAGFKPATAMSSPDGRMGYVPRERVMDAMKAGFKIGQPGVQKMGEGANQVGAIEQRMRDFGRGSINPQMTTVGDVLLDTAGSIAHTSTPSIAKEAYQHYSGQPNTLRQIPGEATMLVGPALLGAPPEGQRMAGATAIDEAIGRGKPALPEVPAGAVSEAAQSLASRILRKVPYLGKVLQAKDLASEIADALRPPAPAPAPPPPPAAPAIFPGANLPASPSQDLLAANALRRGGAVPPPESASALGSIKQANVPAATYLPTTRGAVESQVRQALGAPEPPKLQPNVPLKSQLPAAQALEGYTPVESSTGMTAFKYDAAARELTVRSGSRGHIYGDVGSDDAAAFASAESKGQAWNTLKQNNVLVAKIINGKRVPVKRAVGQTDLETQLQESINQAKARQSQ